VKTASTGPSVQLCITASLASNSSCRPSWANGPKQGFLCTFLRVLHPVPEMSSPSFLLCCKKFSCNVPQSIAPHIHSSPLVHRVTTPCLGNSVAGDQHLLAASIISSINHWNCPLIELWKSFCSQ